MFVTSKRLMLLHLGGKLIHTTADHPFYDQGKGRTPADHFRAG